jgi:hypothetical protein
VSNLHCLQLLRGCPIFVLFLVSFVTTSSRSFHKLMFSNEITDRLHSLTLHNEFNFAGNVDPFDPTQHLCGFMPLRSSSSWKWLVPLVSDLSNFVGHLARLHSPADIGWSVLIDDFIYVSCFCTLRMTHTLGQANENVADSAGGWLSAKKLIVSI